MHCPICAEGDYFPEMPRWETVLTGGLTLVARPGRMASGGMAARRQRGCSSRNTTAHSR